MITGSVTEAREAVVWLKIRGTNGLQVDLEAVVDTGFSGFVSLPQTWMDALALPQVGSVEMTLASGDPWRWPSMKEPFGGTGRNAWRSSTAWRVTR